MIIKKITDPLILKISLGMIIALKFTVSFNTGLFEDEAIYWNWSLNPDPSYSITTLAAISIFNTLPGFLNEFTVRISALFTNFAILFFFLKTGRMLGFSEKKILTSLIFLFSLPFITIYTSFISPDSMLLMFSVISVYFALRIIKFGSYSDWILCGVSFGFLILSKYTGAVFVFAFAVFLFVKRREIPDVNQKKIFTSLAAMCIMISPMLYWNIINEPVWLNYYISTGADSVNPGFAENLWKFLLSQIAILLPIAFLFIVYLVIIQIKKSRRSLEESFLLFSGIFIFCVFTALSFTGKLKGNWAFTAYIPLAMSFLYIKRNRFVTAVLTLLIGVNLFLLILLNLDSSQIKNIADNKFGNYINNTFHDYWPGYNDLAGNDRNWEDRILKMKHWQANIIEINNEIVSRNLKYDFLASNNFNLSPLLKFYLKKDDVYLMGDLRFRYINSAEVNYELTGKDAVIISYKDSDMDFLKNKFDEVNEIKDMRFIISDDLVQEFKIIQCRNFKPEFVTADE